MWLVARLQWRRCRCRAAGRLLDRRWGAANTRRPSALEHGSSSASGSVVRDAIGCVVTMQVIVCEAQQNRSTRAREHKRGRSPARRRRRRFAAIAPPPPSQPPFTIPNRTACLLNAARISGIGPAAT